MKDRNVEFPRRYRMTKVTGTDDVYDLTPVPGEVWEEGTPRNVANDLSDATAALFGLTADAVQDDVLGNLGLSKRHYWDTYKMLYQLRGLYSGTADINLRTAVTVQVADSIVAAAGEKAVLVNPVDVPLTISADGAAAAQAALAGKYFAGLSLSSIIGGVTVTADTVFYLDPATVVEFRDTDAYDELRFSGKKTIWSAYAQAVWEYAGTKASTNPNAYANGAIIDGLIYSYMGVPLNTALSPTRSAKGCYAGTGAASKRIELGFDPGLVIVKTVTGVTWIIPGFRNAVGVKISAAATGEEPRITAVIVSWASAGAVTIPGANSAGMLYSYAALG